MTRSRPLLAAVRIASMFLNIFTVCSFTSSDTSLPLKSAPTCCRPSPSVSGSLAALNRGVFSYTRSVDEAVEDFGMVEQVGVRPAGVLGENGFDTSSHGRRRMKSLLPDLLPLFEHHRLANQFMDSTSQTNCRRQ
ncbi:hypothetical protein GGR56DRAFT_55912 [Xylariaceae sp. FL0804]|nr:hypothetical protein GGR56DRAFT_55912 [Xylariaceae sp. FL0804]